ncbi:MAG: RluA family pseudouridine synthase [Pleomorphochaeta sp.]
MIERRILPQAKAKKHLEKLFNSFDTTNKISDEISCDILFKDKGSMFGILVCLDESDNEVILKAFSASINSTYIIDGYVPPLFDIAEFNKIVEKYDSKIKELTKKIKEGDNDLSLLKQRKELSNKSLLEIQDLYKFYNIDKKEINLSQIKKEKYVPTGTGDCCAPKLLNYAFRNNLHPISLIEGFYGKSTQNKQHLKIYPPCEEKCSIILPYMLNLDILYADDYICVVNKQANITTIPGKKIELKDCITSRVKSLFKNSIDQSSTHRLDMDTSGLLVLAFDKASHRSLSIQFQNREVEKQYIALLRGIVKQEEGEINLPLRLDVDNRPYQIVDHLQGKNAKTFYKRLNIEKNKQTQEIVTRILFIPKTGRTHQLRVHSKEMLFPIVGDRLYGKRLKDEKRMALHASFIKFKHPFTDKIMEFNSSPDF